MFPLMQMMQHNVKRQKENNPEKISMSLQREVSGTKVWERDPIHGEMQAGKGYGATHDPGGELEDLKKEHQETANARTSGSRNALPSTSSKGCRSKNIKDSHLR